MSYLQLKNSRFATQAATSSFNIAQRGEVDLRAEMDDILYGLQSGTRHGYPVVLRTARRTAEGLRQDCTCKGEITHEPDPDCSFCFGEGFLSDENWTWTFSMFSGSSGGLTNRLSYLPPGALRVDYKIFFFRYDTQIRYGDKIVEILLDTEGEVVLPLTRETIYQIETINRHRSDNGRVEYISVYCKESEAIRPDV